MNEAQRQIQREKHAQQEVYWKGLTSLEQHERIGNMYFQYHADPERELNNCFYSSSDHLDDSYLDENEVCDTLTSINCATEEELMAIS